MPNTIIIKNSSTVSDVPTAGQLEQGELAINLLDEKLYSKNSSNLIFEIGGGAEVNDLSAAVTWANIPIANVPTGTSSVTVALGDHLHTGVYEPIDSAIIRSDTGYTRTAGDGRYNDSIALQFGTAGDVHVEWDATRLKFTGLANNQSVWFTNGQHVRLYDASDTGWFDMHHDDLDVVFSAAGATRYKLNTLPTRMVQAYIQESASAAADYAGEGQLWSRNDAPNTLWFTADTGLDRPIGYNAMPPVTISASQNFLLSQVGSMLHKSSGVAVTLTCAQDTNTWDGATWAVHNDDTEDLTIAAGASVTVYWLEAGSAPAAGSVTVEQGGLVTVYKLSNTEFWVWGGKEVNPGLTYPLTPQDNEKIIFGTGSDAEIYSDGTDLYIDLATTADFRLRGGSANDPMITAFPNSFVQLSYDGVVKFSTVSAGVNITGTLTADGLDIDDNHHLYLGTSDDVDMYFNATDFYIDLIDGADFRVRGGTGETEPMIEGYANNAVYLYHNGGLEFRTQQHEAASVTSGAEVFDHAGTMRDVGFNHVKEIAVTATVELSNLHAGNILRKSNAGTYDIDMAASTTEFPVGSMCTVINHGTGGSLTIDNDLETMYVLDGSGTVSANTGFVLAVGGVVTIWRQGTSVYYVWGAGIP